MPKALPTAARLHDIVAIGASAGGLEPLRTMLDALPADLPAALLVVLHMGASSHLAEVLRTRSRLPVRQAASGDRIEAGCVYVAVPDRHLMLHDRHILLRRGPRENLSRPAIDPLFRSAACTFGGRVIGMVLSGALNDGTAGLRAIKRCGGLALVQDPQEAAVDSMPRSALRHVDVDAVAPSPALAGELARMVHLPAGRTPEIPFEIRLETAIAAQELAGMDTENRLGQLSHFTCPECHGTLWEIDDGNLLRYRCHVGHAYTAEAMLDAQAVSAEHMLWSLMRGHRERAAMARRMAERERDQHHAQAAASLLARATGYDEDADTVLRLLNGAGAAIAGEAATADRNEI